MIYKQEFVWHHANKARAKYVSLRRQGTWPWQYFHLPNKATCTKPDLQKNNASRFRELMLKLTQNNVCQWTRVLKPTIPTALRASQDRLVTRKWKENAARTAEIAGQDTEGSCTAAVSRADAYRFWCRTLFGGDKPRVLCAQHSDSYVHCPSFCPLSL